MPQRIGILLALPFLVSVLWASEQSGRIPVAVDLTPFQILGSDGKVRFQMDREGKVMNGRQELMATITSDGSLLDKKGNLLARLSPEGEFKGGTGKLIARISESGAVAWPDGKKAKWLDDGVFEMGHPEIKPQLKPKALKSRIAPSILLVSLFTLTTVSEIE